MWITSNGKVFHFQPKFQRVAFFGQISNPYFHYSPFISSQDRSSRSQMFFQMCVLKNFANFTGKHLCWSLFLQNTNSKSVLSKIP